MSETILSVLPHSDGTSRLVVVLKQSATAGTYVELQQQSWGHGVGWFTQTRLEVEKSQLPQLRTALGGHLATSAQHPVEAPATLPFPTRTPEEAAGGLDQVEIA